ncbi:hypothetical protein F2Q70_00002878 [Brassica cretica]|uniref:Uncharacterized protein n=1 Tax=Brassica cretica TaxID=69181 RepID=A0A8S9ITH7_BRACR|nr:hypothetical protein F2Q70_00002878 [Brassica cretica]
MMCVDHGVRLGEAQFSSGGVTYSQRLVNVKWVAPMDKRCMTIRPVLDWEKPNSRSYVFRSYDLVFVVRSVQGGEVGLRVVKGSRDVSRDEIGEWSYCIAFMFKYCIAFMFKILHCFNSCMFTLPRCIIAVVLVFEQRGGVTVEVWAFAGCGGRGQHRFSGVVCKEQDVYVFTRFDFHGVGNQQGGSGSRMRNVVRLRRVGQVSGAAGYDGSSESSSSSESESDSNFENENAVESTDNSHETGSSDFEEAEAWKPFRKASSDSFNFQYGYGNKLWDAMEISSSDVEIIEPPPPEIIGILLGSKTVTTKLTFEKRLEQGCRVATNAQAGRYVATELSPKLGCYVATELSPKLGGYVATELSPKLGRYVSTEHVHGSVAT